MTWQQWVNSSYNTAGFAVNINTEYENTIATDYTFSWLVADADDEYVYTNNTIIANYAYKRLVLSMND